MDKIVIRGGKHLYGKIAIGGAKNAALPLMTACLLTDQPLVLSNMPHLADITTMAHLLNQHGVEIRLNGEGKEGSSGRVVELNAAHVNNTTAPYDLVRKMRASILVLGPLLARFKQAKVSLPGGCAIGTRPVDLHIQGLQAMGAKVEIENGYIVAEAPKGLKGTRFVFPIVSVTGTENLMMAATLADGETTLINAAREPEVIDLAQCLMAMGAQIKGAGTDTITIQGQKNLHGAQHSVIPDRIETGTYVMAVGATGGEVELTGTSVHILESMVATLGKAGVIITPTNGGMKISRDPQKPLTGVDMMTEPYPGFPTDLQAQFMALMLMAKGASMVTETIFENRFMHVPELLRMGANISVQGSSALIRGVDELNGAPVMATDLRASVSLVIAGLTAQGETSINRVYHLDRGYERLEEKLIACGADIERVKDTANIY